MNVTFFIGNGFDLNLGLKTRYADFYEYYTGRPSSDGDMLVDAIKKKPQKWSDLEIALGEFTEKLQRADFEAFLNSKEQMEEELADYLAKQENRIRIVDEMAAATEFRNSVVSFYKGLNRAWQDDYGSFLRAQTTAIHYAFVNFNYTSTLDRLIALCQQRLDPFSTHVGGSTRFSDLIDNPLHIHGTLSSSLILGVDAEAQIKNLEMRKDADILNYFVKPSINKASGEKRTEACKKIIDQSQYICLYGLSCGDTDQIWWKYILEWLKRGSGNRLVIYMYSNKSRSPSAGRELRMIDQIKYFFKKQSLCSDEIFAKIRDRIAVVFNSDVFSLSNITVLSDEQLLAEEKEQLVGAV